MVVLRRLVPNSLYPVRLGGDPRLALEVFAVSRAHGGTAAVLRAIETIALTTAALFEAISILSHRSVIRTFSG